MVKECGLRGISSLVFPGLFVSRRVSNTVSDTGVLRHRDSPCDDEQTGFIS